MAERVACGGRGERRTENGELAAALWHSVLRFQFSVLRYSFSVIRSQLFVLRLLEA